jgi:putative lipoprotein
MRHDMKRNLVWACSGTAWLLAIGLCVANVASGDEEQADGMKSIEGSVWYRERIALTPNARIHVLLEDVARMDAPSVVIAESTIVPRDGPPWHFSLAYDPHRLNDRGRYTLRVRIEADGQLLFINTEQIPAFNHGADSPLAILVSRVGGKRTDERPSTRSPDVSLTETYWKLIELDGQPASLGAGERELHIVIVSGGNRVRGFSGCNRFTGHYELNEGQLRFGQLASTRMACMEGMEQEQRFLKLLTEAMQFTLSGDELALHGSDGRSILRFRAVALK